MDLKKLVNKNLKSLGNWAKGSAKISPKILRIAAILLIGASLGYVAKSLLFAASVNGELITRIALIKELERQGGSQALDNMVTKTLIFQEAKKKGVGVTQAEIDTEIKRIEGLVSQQGTSLDEALAAQGQTRTQLNEQMRLQKTVEKLLADKLSVSQDEIKKYFEDNKNLYGKDSKLADVTDKIKSDLTQQKLSAAYQSWISDLRAHAKIHHFVSF